MEIIGKSLRNWYTKTHMVNSLNYFLKREGFKVYKEESESETKEAIIFAIANGKKEIIQIKGNIENTTVQPGQFLPVNNDNFSCNLLESLISLTKANRNKTFPVSLCLPFLPPYLKMIEILTEVFTERNLNMNIYLVQSDGSVKKCNLNNGH